VEMAGLWLQQTENIRGYVWHIYSLKETLCHCGDRKAVEVMV
jgi:hypothetical protein